MVVTINEVYPYGVGARPELRPRMVATLLSQDVIINASGEKGGEKWYGPRTSTHESRNCQSWLLSIDPVLEVNMSPPSSVSTNPTWRESSTMVSSLLNKNKIMPFLLVALSTSWMVQASDLDIVSDSVVPEKLNSWCRLFHFYWNPRYHPQSIELPFLVDSWGWFYWHHKQTFYSNALNWRHFHVPGGTCSIQCWHQEPCHLYLFIS